MKHEIYKACGFRVTRSQYNIIIQKLLPEGARFTINKRYIIQKEEYIPNYL